MYRKSKVNKILSRDNQGKRRMGDTDLFEKVVKGRTREEQWLCKEKNGPYDSLWAAYNKNKSSFCFKGHHLIMGIHFNTHCNKYMLNHKDS